MVESSTFDTPTPIIVETPLKSRPKRENIEEILDESTNVFEYLDTESKKHKG